MAGDPDLRTSGEIVIALAEAGVDMVELGVPFSEPIADGPVIQRAGERALRQGAYLPAILDLWFARFAAPRKCLSCSSAT